MTLPVTIPNTFANATSSIPLANLDANFVTIYGAVNGIGNGAEALSNVTITGGTIENAAVGGSTAAAGAFTTLNTSGAVVFNDAGADVDFRVEGDTDANLLFVDASTDRVGVGTNAPGDKFQVAGNALFGTGSSAVTIGGATATAGGATDKNLTLSAWSPTSGVNEYGGNLILAAGRPIGNGSGVLGSVNIKVGKGGATSSTAGSVVDAITADIETLTFKTGETERARIDSSGNLLVGTTSAFSQIGKATFASGASGNGLIVQAGNSSTAYQSTNASGTGAYYAAIWSNNGNSFSTCGTIEVSGSTTSYNTSSDYRLKENVAPMTGALAKVLELNPVTYTWKVDGSDGQGFIAHELQEVAPYAVSGEKDGEQMQGVDYGKITPLLTAALQEAIAEIQSLKARVAELEAK
jgi:hypothetical protein